VACDPLPDRRECISSKLFQDVVQPVDRLLRESPCQRRIVPRRALDTFAVTAAFGAWLTTWRGRFAPVIRIISLTYE
jgi:hypothetical protein